MSTDNSNEWVGEGTPREDWDTSDDYGVEVDPTEWNDYSDEQAVHVPTPAAARDYQPPVEQPEAEATDSEEAVAEDPEQAVAAPEGAAEEELFGRDPIAAPEGAEEPVVPDTLAEDIPAPDVEETQVRARPVIPAADFGQEPVAAPEADAEEPVDAAADEQPVDEVPTQDEPEADEVQEPTDEEVPGEEQTAQFSPFAESEGAPEPAPEQDDSAPIAPPVAAAAAGAGAAGFASVYRQDDDQAPEEDHTQVLDQSRLEDEEAEERAREARLQEQREARDARLGIVSGSEDGGQRVVEKPVKRQADKFLGAFSMFILRTIVAAIIGVLGYQVLQNVDGTEAFLSTTVIPEPRLVAWILGFGLVTMAVMLVLGLGARIVGFLLAALAIASLATIRWGSFSIFVDGMEGFYGDRTLLTVGAALAIMAFGAGRFSIDGAIYAARQKAKAKRDE